MGRKGRSIILLCLVLALIYFQQGAVGYAEHREDPTQTEEGGSAEEGEGTEDPDEGEEEEPEEPEEEPVKKFQLKVIPPDGGNGYYRHKPEVTLTHVSRRGITRYRAAAGDKILAEGSLEKEGEKAILGDWEEGSNQLTVWMEEDKEPIEDCAETMEIRVDTWPPKISMSLPNGFDAWYLGDVKLSVQSRDKTSGVETVRCLVDGEKIGASEKEETAFTIQKASAAGQGAVVEVTARDRAGNESRLTERVYIDRTDPKIRISGASDYLISSRPVTLVSKVQEENVLHTAREETIWENEDGEKKTLKAVSWKDSASGKQAERKLTEDGIYQISLAARDQAGREAKEQLQVIIDQKDPVIRLVDQLRGKYMKKFVWDTPAKKWIQDFTTYSYELRLDGRLYSMGEEVTEEGWHVLEVCVEDAAGNTARANAGFMVDHTAPQIQILDVEDGGTYEEQAVFRVKTGKAEDEIKEVRINGEQQKLIPGRESYQYTLDDYGNYEIRVKAEDYAGNSAEEKILIRVAEEKNLLQKVAEPVARRLGLTKEKEEPEETPAQEEKGSIAPWMIGGFGLAAVAGGSGWLLWRRKK